MNAQAEQILSQMLEQFRARHSRLPLKIVIAPLACLALAIKNSLAPTWQGVPVECRDIQESEATADRAQVRSLAVFVIPEDSKARLVACDIKT
jgi:hypothetical protein